MFSFKAYVILGLCFIYQVRAYNRLMCECGVMGQSNRIVGGWSTAPHQYPWMVPIYNKKVIYCGGAIINTLYILTAGHCLRWVGRPEDITIEAGSHDRRYRNIENIYQADKLIVHPDFYSYKLYDENDIALIRLQRPLTFTDKVRPVCLPERGSTYYNEYATVAGWGKLGTERKLSTDLQETVVKILTDRDCAQTKMRSFLSPTVMCAYFNKADSCQGDSGGPLVYEKEPGKMEQIGIVSWGIGCATNSPGMYTKVTEYLDWIYHTTSDGFFCSF